MLIGREELEGSRLVNRESSWSTDRPARAHGRLEVAAGLAWALAAAGMAWSRARRPPPPATPPKPGLSRQTVAEPAHFEAQEPGRGRVAPGPHAIPWRGWKDILWRTGREAAQDRITIVAASVTFFTLLAIFPALGVFVSLYGLIADVALVKEQLGQLSAVFPPEAVRLLGEQMMRLAESHTGSLSAAFVISLLFSLWSASAGMRSLFDGLNIVYDETESRNFFLRSALAYLFTLALLTFLVLVSGILVAAPIVLDALGLRERWMIAARWPLVYAVAAGSFLIAYRFGPSRTRARWRWLVPGALAAAFFWLAGSAAFSWYVNNLARLDVTYGSLGAVIAFMLWVWLSAVIVLMGAELNAEMEHQTALDSTVGPPKPMGERGAAMADTVGLRFVGLRQGAGMLWGMLRRQGRRLLNRGR